VATIDGDRVVVLEEAPSSFSIFGF
jgi:hypothetical protein